MTTETPPDWVLIEAAKRSDCDVYRRDGAFLALCDMIQKYEKPPVDRKVLCAREALCWRSGYGVGSKNYAEVTSGKHDEIFDYELTLCAHAIELWEEGFGK